MSLATTSEWSGWNILFSESLTNENISVMTLTRRMAAMVVLDPTLGVARGMGSWATGASKPRATLRPPQSAGLHAQTQTLPSGTEETDMPASDQELEEVAAADHRVCHCFKAWLQRLFAVISGCGAPEQGYLAAGNNVPGYEGILSAGSDDCASKCAQVMGCAAWTLHAP